MKHYAIIGYPLGHTFSPAMHNHAFKHYGIDAVYEPRSIPPEGFEKGLQQLRDDGIRGFNITIPYKQRILSHLQKLDTLAEKIGAVNTVVCREDGRWIGYNTDAYGFLLPLREMLKNIRNILVLGAGGAARAVAFSLVTEAAPASLTLVNRTPARARELKSALEEHTAVPIKCYDSTSFKSDIKYDLIVNTTSVGMGRMRGESPLPGLASCVHEGSLVYDLIYNPSPTRLLEQAAALHLKTLNGLPMLIGQGSRAFYLWNGLYFPEDVGNIFSTA